MPAGAEDYDGIRYEDMLFEDVDWSEVGEHDPANRSSRKGPSEIDVLTAWADEAVLDPRRWVRDSGSASGLTVKVTGYSASARFVVTVVLAPKDSPPTWRWWGATAWKSKKSEEQRYESEGP